MTTTPSPTAPATTTCLACGYDLAGLSSDANCPECAYAVRLSLEGVENVPTHTFVTMARGSRMLFWCTMLCTFSPLALVLPATPMSWLAAVLFTMLVVMMTLVGGWAITPNLRGWSDAGPKFLRVAVRFATLSLPSAVLAVVVLHHHMLRWLVLASILSVVFTLPAYIRSLGQRLGSDEVAAAAGAVLWCIAAVAIVLGISSLGSIVLDDVMWCFAITAVIPVVLGVIIAMFMFSLLASTLRSRAALADWHANKATPA